MSASSFALNNRTLGRQSRSTLLTAVPAALTTALVALFVALCTTPAPTTAAPREGTGLSQANNVTSLSGTWSTGTGHVKTGIDFYNPGTMKFKYPRTAGMSYSFTDDGFFETAMYQYQTNGSDPKCVTTNLIWQHGTYERNDTNWLILTPFKADGALMHTSRCEPQSEKVQWYGQQELLKGFQIGLDQHWNVPNYFLQLYNFDGALKPVMWQQLNPPQMLPTQALKQD